MKNKVAILTQPLHTNYGGTLQAFALQKVIKNMGHDVVTLNYQWKKRSFLRYILVTIRNYIFNRKEGVPFFPSEQIFREKNHTDFIEKNIIRSEIIFSENDLLNHFKKNNYDVVIVGSDQVWRVEYSPNIEHFFLSFIDHSIKKIAYAASFGIDKWQFSAKETEKIKLWLERFDNISVREKSALLLCQDFLSVDVEHVLDPTLLLTKDDYLQLTASVPVSGEKIFTYILDDTEDKKNIVNLIANKLKLATFTKQPLKTRKDEIFVKNKENYLYPEIEEWVASFRDASFIVTDSFHGMVFSIIFNKPFVVINNSSRGSARFISLLDELDIKNRLFDCVEDISLDLIVRDLDYKEINKRLEDARIFSKKFLKISLCEADLGD
ncbi:polysaccharide pyruvyl transferase family protein [Acinetobacter sp. SwsAc7]|nr:polysaccharide pyruvyl transferase family protein [Acinetobacter sp. SwsAc7]